MRCYLKYSPFEHLKLYAGVRWAANPILILGVKVAGFKVLIPWTNLQYTLFPWSAEDL